MAIKHHGPPQKILSSGQKSLFPRRFPKHVTLSFEYDVKIEAFWNEEDLISEFSNDLIDSLMEQRTKKEEVGLLVR
jgi:hypothetical protein